MSVKCPVMRPIAQRPAIGCIHQPQITGKQSFGDQIANVSQSLVASPLEFVKLQANRPDHFVYLLHTLLSRPNGPELRQYTGDAIGVHTKALGVRLCIRGIFNAAAGHRGGNE